MNVVSRRPIGLLILTTIGGLAFTLMVLCSGGVLGLAGLSSVLPSPSTSATHVRMVVGSTPTAATQTPTAPPMTNGLNAGSSTPSGLPTTTPAPTTAARGAGPGGTGPGGTSTGGTGSGATVGKSNQASPAQCGGDYYVNSDGKCVHRPTTGTAPPPGATAQCKDGTYSFSQHRQGTCSGHGGVARWL